MYRIFGGALFGSLALASCTTELGHIQSPTLQTAMADAEAAGLRVLTHEELERLLVGHSVRYDARSFQGTPYEITFLPDGTFVTLGHRNVRIGGTYRFRERTICTTIIGYPEECSIFAVDGSGRYFRKGVGSQYGSALEVVIE